MARGIHIVTKTPRPEEQETCFDGLLGCHERIRHFTSVSQKIAGAAGQPLDHIASAAESVHRYFTVALPLHEADENQSVDPRVQRFIPEPELLAASSTMVVQHRDINAILQRLLPLWDALRTQPEKLPDFAVNMAEDSARLAHLFDAHLRLEEEVIFPAMRRYLPPHELEDIYAEMRTRRS